MEAIWVVELWLSGAGEIGISFLERACSVRAVAEARLLDVFGDGNKYREWVDATDLGYYS